MYESRAPQMPEKVYAKLKDTLEREIASLIRKPGDMLPPEKELAEQYRISRSSVRAALAELEKENLIFKKPGLGTFVKEPDAVPFPPPQPKPVIRKIGVDARAVYDVCGYDSYFLLVSDALLNASRGRGLELVMIGDAGMEELSPQNAAANCDAFLITRYERWTEQQLARLANPDKPVVVLNAPALSNREYSFLSIDNVREAFRATEYLLQIGHRRIAFLGQLNRTVDERFRGYAAAIRRYGLAPDPALIMRKELTPNNAASLKTFLSKGNFTALLIASESLFEFILAPLFYESGIRIPEDLSVISFDFIQRRFFSTLPRISHIRIPVEEMIVQALDILTSMPYKKQNTTLEAELVLLHSCKNILPGVIAADFDQISKEAGMTPIQNGKSDSALSPALIQVPSKPEHYSENRKFQGIPSIAVLPDGTLLAVWYTGGRGEGPNNFCVVARSTDGGVNWQDPWLVIQHQEPDIRTFDPNVWVAPDGSLWLFWNQSRSLREGNVGDGRLGVWGARCRNPLAGEMQWEQPIRIANGVMMNKPRALSNGEWAFPTALWNDLVEHGAAPVREELRKEKFSNITISPDEGKSFFPRGSADVPERCYDENQIVELRDGRLWMLVRTCYGVGQSFSSDMGKSWSPGSQTAFRSPNSRFFMGRLSSGRLLFIANDDDSGLDYRKHPWRTRRNLTAYLSDDDGRTWSGGLLLDSRENVSYPDAAEDENGNICVIYDYQRHKGGFILLSRITEDDILARHLVAEGSFLARTVSSYPYDGMTAESGKLTPLEERIQADEPFTLIPPQLLPVTDPALYPENSNFIQSGGFERTRSGRIWITWTAGGDNENAYLMSAWSDDEGKHWTHPKFMIPNAISPHGFRKSSSCGVFWTDPLGRLWWIFDCRLGSFDGRSGTWCAICENPDADAPRWNPPFRIWHGVCLNRPLVLADGTWIMAISLWPRHRIYGFPGQDWGYDRYSGNYTKELDPERKAWIFASRDNGQTWVRRGGVEAPQREFDEPSVIERKDGSLLMYIRTYYGLAEAESSDQGYTWSDARPSSILHPNARIFTCRLQSGRLLMVRHERREGEAPARNNLTAYLSDDEAKTWYGAFRFENRASVSYPDGFQHPDGRIFIQYDHGRINGSLQMSIFTEEDVAAGKSVSGKTVLGETIMQTKSYKSGK